MTPDQFRPARRYGVGGLPKEMVDAMWADFQRTGSLIQTGRIWKRSSSTLGQLFAQRGLRARPKPNHLIVKGRRGQFVKTLNLTEEQILAEVDAVRRVMIPSKLRSLWRDWTLERRAELVRRMHARIDAANPKKAMPTGPCSSNVEPFDYGSPRAREIERAQNDGADSRMARTKLKLFTRGLIYRGRLYYWTVDTYYNDGKWREGQPRKPLQWCVWEDHHGRPVPPHHVVVHLDGNKNNLAPENLALKSRNEMCRENQAKSLQRRSRELTTLLLKRAARKETDERNTLDGQIFPAGLADGRAQGNKPTDKARRHGRARHRPR